MTRLNYISHALLQSKIKTFLNIIFCLCILLVFNNDSFLYCMTENTDEHSIELNNIIADSESQEHLVSITIRPSDNDILIICITTIIITYILYLGTNAIKSCS